MKYEKREDVPEVSVVIPVYNEEAVLPALFDRLYKALDAMGRSYECVFIDDGSADRSGALLREQFGKRPQETRVILFNGNFGQHAAILAGFRHCRGRRVVTLDADLQNPPEEIPNLLAKMDEGYDYVGTSRRRRQDILWRKDASRLMNRVRHRITHIQMTDQGCMLRAYDRSIIDAITATREINTYIPALAYMYAARPVEIQVELAGIGVSILSGLLMIYMFLRRIFIGPEVEGVFTLFAIAFFFIGILLFGIGLLGEYVGRIYQQVRERPRYLIRGILENQDDEESPRKEERA
ncbi:MAG: glycosyltransferase [Desulfuromonadales bacterium]